MKKYFSHIPTSVLGIVIVFAISGFLFPQTTWADHCRPGEYHFLLGCRVPLPGEVTVASGVGQAVSSAITVGSDILLAPFGWLAIFILQVASLITYLAGAILNFVVQFTIVEMKINLEKADAINTAWKTIRDVANMTFIFVLLYAAVQTILGIGSDAKKLIVNVVIVAILINFSLFFTKTVIDASNVLSLVFYDAIAPGALTGEASLDRLANLGLSGELMGPLQVQSLFDIRNQSNGTVSLGEVALQGKKLIIIGVMGTVVALITAFIFFAIAVMFVIRFVVLIFVLILSPVAFVSFVLPQLKKYRDQWWSALSGQAFFAPIYFLLTWIVIVVSKGLFGKSGSTMAAAFIGTVNPDGSVGSPPAGSMGILVNFIIMIALLIASIVIAKEWANKAGSGVAQITKWATGAVGGVALGGLGLAGRASIGRLGTMAAESARLQEAAKKERGFAGRMTMGAASRLALYASEKAGKGSFDARSATIPTSVIGDLARGTIGRTKIGKKIGFDDINVPSVPVGALAAGQTGVGTGGTKGYIDTRAESEKRVQEREAKSADDLTQAQTRRDVSEGAKLGAPPNKIEDMEKALSKLTDKEIEALVANNRELLKSQNFANAISVKQLEALNKSDRFSETEKSALKTERFKEIDTAIATGGAATATPAIRAKIRALSESELEMINPAHLKDRGFVEQMKTSQFESINKSNKFTSRQKDDLRTTRQIPLKDAVARGNTTDTQKAMKNLGPKELAGLDFADLIKSTMLKAYTQQMLKRMGPELNPNEILPLGQAVVREGGPAAKWVESQDGINNGFSV